MDVTARYDFTQIVSALHGLVATASASNVFNRNPPFVVDGTTQGYFSGTHYDAANASPLDRFFSIGLTKHW